MNDSRWRLVLLLALFAGSGAACPRRMVPPAHNAPVLFQRPPTTIAEVIAPINANKVQQLQAENATLTIPGVPALRAKLALDRPRRIRLQAELMGLTGPELDLGSNDELFWLWIKRSPQPAVHFARHDRFAGSAARQILPIEPHWLIEALGLLYLDPNESYEGPYPAGENRLSIRTRMNSTSGPLSRVIVVDATYGFILEQQVFDAQNQLLASAVTSKHQFYTDAAVSLPHRVQIQLPPAKLSFQLDVPSYAINYLPGDPAQLFTIPSMQGTQYVDLTGPEFRPPAGPNTPWQPPANPVPAEHPYTSFRPRYRGLLR